jgi:hypothetical protein
MKIGYIPYHIKNVRTGTLPYDCGSAGAYEPIVSDIHEQCLVPDLFEVIKKAFTDGTVYLVCDKIFFGSAKMAYLVYVSGDLEITFGS